MSFGKGSKGFKFSEGDWTCTGCGNVNFARRIQCNRCGEEKKLGVKKIKKGGVQIGKQLAEKSKGLFSADDWMCKTCANVNWARRSECNMCNTPRVGLQDERTGLGGGFNERGTVEYKEKQDSDDEYDMFGRRKRKKEANGTSSSARRESPYKEEEKDESDDGDSDDDDDSDEDADLSKYNLEDDDEEDEDDEDVSKYDIAASDSDSEDAKSRSRSPHKRHHSSSSDTDDDDRSKRKHRRSRSRSRSRSPRDSRK